jgi:hypothetical protein
MYHETAVRAPRVQAQSKRVLGVKGLAICVSPSAAVLPPFGEARITLVATNDMCGTYADTLHCQARTFKDPICAPGLSSWSSCSSL